MKNAVEVLIEGYNFWAVVAQKKVLRCLSHTEKLDCGNEWCADRETCLKLQRFLRRIR